VKSWNKATGERIEQNSAARDEPAPPLVARDAAMPMLNECDDEDDDDEDEDDDFEVDETMLEEDNSADELSNGEYEDDDQYVKGRQRNWRPKEIVEALDEYHKSFKVPEGQPVHPKRR
jgi:hypothetical protein